MADSCQFMTSEPTASTKAADHFRTWINAKNYQELRPGFNSKEHTFLPNFVTVPNSCFCLVKLAVILQVEPKSILSCKSIANIFSRGNNNNNNKKPHTQQNGNECCSAGEKKKSQLFFCHYNIVLFCRHKLLSFQNNTVSLP